MAKIDAIQALYQRGWSYRRIAKELGVHRDTVARQIQLQQAAAKPARAPIGSAAELRVIPEAEAAPPPEGVPPAKPATLSGGASRVG